MAEQNKNQFLRLLMNCGGYAVIKDVRQLLNKDGAPNGNLGVTLAYEGGSASLTIPESKMTGFQVGEVVEARGIFTDSPTALRPAKWMTLSILFSSKTLSKAASSQQSTL